ncbi:MAG: hypothetical protein K1X75_14915 [Leptospirales bacterium]|nr:hypothetical protein [Leptospirales bacterium]
MISCREAWQQLAIKPTKDPAVLRRAYARRLKEINADEDPAAFMRLRESYELLKSLVEGRELRPEDLRISTLDVSPRPEWQDQPPPPPVWSSANAHLPPFVEEPELAPSPANDQPSGGMPGAPPESELDLRRPYYDARLEHEMFLAQLRQYLESGQEADAVALFDRALTRDTYENFELRAQLEAALLAELEQRVPVPSVFGEHIYSAFQWSQLRQGDLSHYNARLSSIRRRLDLGETLAKHRIESSAKPKSSTKKRIPVGLIILAIVLFNGGRLCLSGSRNRHRNPPSSEQREEFLRNQQPSSGGSTLRRPYQSTPSPTPASPSPRTSPDAERPSPSAPPSSWDEVRPAPQPADDPQRLRRQGPAASPWGDSIR